MAFLIARSVFVLVSGCVCCKQRSDCSLQAWCYQVSASVQTGLPLSAHPVQLQQSQPGGRV
jgi:hypothetical protein